MVVRCTPSSPWWSYAIHHIQHDEINYWQIDMPNILAIRDRMVNGFVGWKYHSGAKNECFCQLKKGLKLLFWTLCQVDKVIPTSFLVVCQVIKCSIWQLQPVLSRDKTTKMAIKMLFSAGKTTKNAVEIPSSSDKITDNSQTYIRYSPKC